MKILYNLKYPKSSRSGSFLEVEISPSVFWNFSITIPDPILRILEIYTLYLLYARGLKKSSAETPSTVRTGPSPYVVSSVVRITVQWVAHWRVNWQLVNHGRVERLKIAWNWGTAAKSRGIAHYTRRVDGLRIRWAEWTMRPLMVMIVACHTMAVKTTIAQMRSVLKRITASSFHPPTQSTRTEIRSVKQDVSQTII